MFRPASLLAALLLPLLVGVGTEAATPIVWTFEEGSTFYVEETLDASQNLSLKGQTENRKSKQTTLYQVQVQSAPEDGPVKLNIRIESIRATGDTAEGNDLFQRMSGASFQATLNREGTVTEFEGYSEFVQRVASGDESQARLFQAVLPEETFRRSLTSALTMIPPKTAEVGTKWNSEDTLKLGPFGSMTLQRTFELTGGMTNGKKVFDVLTITGSGRYSRPQGEFAQLPFKVTDGTLTVQKFEGTAVFDSKAGRLETVKLTFVIGGELTIGVGSQSEAVTLKQTNDVTIRILDRKPGRI